MAKCCPLYKIFLVLAIVGAINWGLVGGFGFDLVEFLFTAKLAMPMLAKIAYILIGVSGIYVGFTVLTCCDGSSCKK